MVSPRDKPPIIVLEQVIRPHRLLQEFNLKGRKMRIAVFVISVAAAALIGAATNESSYPAFLHAIHESMTQMQDAMHRPGTGNPDRDFALMMIPHHQGAIEMAKVELQYGGDPVLRRLAQEIVADQQSEIDVMQLWLTKKSGAAREEK